METRNTLPPLHSVELSTNRADDALAVLFVNVLTVEVGFFVDKN